MKNDSSFFLLCMGLSLSLGGPRSVAEALKKEAPCGVLTQVGHGSQIIPPKGKILVKLKADDEVVCGSMIITHEDGLWFKHKDQSVFKIAPDSFVEIGKTQALPHRLYRGEILVTSPPKSSGEEWITLNSKITFTGGVAWMGYDPKQKETTVASFNRILHFANKFNPLASTDLRVGEMSHLRLGDPRLVPTQAEVMHVSSVKESVERFGLTEAEQEEMTHLVERVYESRSKSLAADIEHWKKLDEEEQETASRSIASVKVKTKAKPAIDDDEAEHTMALFKKKVFGEEDLDLLDENRKPASVNGNPLKDPAYEHTKKKKAAEAQKVMDAITDLKTD